MSGAKLENAKAALRFIARELKPADSLGIVAFSTDVRECVPLTRMDAAGVARVLAAVDGVRATGNTALHGGVVSSIAQVLRQPLPTDIATGELPVYKTPISKKTVAPHGSGFLSSWFGGSAPSAAAATVAPPPQPAPAATEQLELSHTLVVGAAAPQYAYTVNVKPGPRIESYELSTADGAIPPAPGSGECEFGFSPVAAPVSALQVKATFAGGAGSATAMYHMGALASKKQTLQLAVPAGAAPAVCMPPTPTPAPAPTPAPQGDVELRVVMVFTDGQANNGITEPSAMVRDIKARLAAPGASDVTIHTFGFGADHNASLLRDISDASQGVFYYVKSIEDLSTLFADCLGAIVGTVAAGVVLRFAPALGVQVLQVLSKQPVRTSRDSTPAWVEVELKELVNSDVRDVPVRLLVDRSVTAAPGAANVGLVTVELRYRDALNAATPREVRATCLLPLQDTAYAGAPDAAVAEQVERFTALVALDEVRELADNGRVAEARTRARAAVTSMSTGAAKESALVQAMASKLGELDEQLVNEHQWASAGRQCTNAMHGGLKIQRAVAASAATDVYQVQTQQQYTRSKMAK
jgi:hypothetical protein